MVKLKLELKTLSLTGRLYYLFALKIILLCAILKKRSGFSRKKMLAMDKCLLKCRM